MFIEESTCHRVTNRVKYYPMFDGNKSRIRKASLCLLSLSYFLLAFGYWSAITALSGFLEHSSWIDQKRLYELY